MISLPQVPSRLRNILSYPIPSTLPQPTRSQTPRPPHPSTAPEPLVNPGLPVNFSIRPWTLKTSGVFLDSLRNGSLLSGFGRDNLSASPSHRPSSAPLFGTPGNTGRKQIMQPEGGFVKASVTRTN